MGPAPLISGKARVHLTRVDHTVDLSDLSRPTLAIVFCEGVWRLSELSNAWGKTAARRARHAALMFSAFLDEVHPTIRQPRTLTSPVMLSWRDWVLRQPVSAAYQESIYYLVKGLLNIVASAKPSNFADDFAIYPFPDLQGQLRGVKTRPYSDSTLAKIKAASQSVAETTVLRLNAGINLLGSAQEPSNGQKPWNYLLSGDAARLWWIVNKLSGRIYRHQEHQHPPEYTQLASVLNYLRLHPRDLYAFLYPTWDDIFNLYIRFLASDGVVDNMGPILNLKLPDLIKFGSGFAARLTKTRPHEKQYVAHWKNGAGIIKTVMSITSRIREISPDAIRDRLWLCYAPGRRQIISTLADVNSSVQQTWATRHGIEGFQLSRFRVTHLTRKYSKSGSLGGLQARAQHNSGDMSAAYVNNPATKDLHDSSLLSAQKTAIKDLFGRGTVADADDNRLKNALVSNLIVSEAHANEIINGSAELFFNSCKDLFNRPGGRPNTRCDQPFSCLECTNSIFLRRHAAILSMLAGHFEQKKDSDPEGWRLKYKTLFEIITKDLLPRFSKITLAEATQRARLQRFYIPQELQ